MAEKANTEVMIGTIYQDESVGKLLNSIVVVGNKMCLMNCKRRIVTTNII
ncbi:Uncharacterised protein [Aggregatibacter aphrophilus]|uniref:Uncharacterized protein n=1 Tax=Aggregatibacter aphrophilus TaxID=732 RepID=A0A336NHS4_AGGAP|nr:Uncharacterised protein [Aggregatibacter aphrophilus]